MISSAEPRTSRPRTPHAGRKRQSRIRAAAKKGSSEPDGGNTLFDRPHSLAGAARTRLQRCRLSAAQMPSCLQGVVSAPSRIRFCMRRHCLLSDRLPACRLLLPFQGRRPVWPCVGPDRLLVRPGGEDALTVRVHTIRATPWNRAPSTSPLFRRRKGRNWPSASSPERRRAKGAGLRFPRRRGRARGRCGRSRSPPSRPQV